MTTTHPALWFTSRSPTEVGQRHCRFARYCQYHAGPHGTGYVRKAMSVPLATGGAVHVGTQLMGEWLLEYQGKYHGNVPRGGQVPLDVIAWAASEAAARYESMARARGFLERGLEDVGSILDDAPAPLNEAVVAERKKLPPAVEHLILEQRTLIEAQVWVFGLVLAPQILSRYRVLDVEREEAIILDCTCGLGVGITDVYAHHDRHCGGIVQQGRADWLLEGWHDEVKGQLVYDEFKTKATPNYPWEIAWEHSGQLMINMETAGRRLGKPINHANIIVLFKGRRQKDYARKDDPMAPKVQDSPLVYGWYDEGSAGLREPAWASFYKYTDDYGKGRALPKTFHRAPVWDESRPLVNALQTSGNVQAVIGTRPDASRIEKWVTGFIPPHVWPNLTKVLGPFPHQVHRVPLALQSVQAEERDWRDMCDIIREQVTAGANEIEIAGHVVSRSWNCTHFDGTPCMFKPICDQTPGWQDPLSMGIYQLRTPHHSTERETYERLGVQFPSELEDAEFDDIDW